MQNRYGSVGVYQYRSFGGFRLLLAVLVMVQHFGADLAPAPLATALAPYLTGSVAVLVFFALSGFVRLRHRHRTPAWSDRSPGHQQYPGWKPRTTPALTKGRQKMEVSSYKTSGNLSVLTFLTVQFYAVGPSDPCRGSVDLCLFMDRIPPASGPGGA
jgi:hypothetical protein